MAALQLAADDHDACHIDAMDLKNRLSNVETDRRNLLHSAILRIVVTTAATASMALTCRGRSRPQHHERTSLWLPKTSSGCRCRPSQRMVPLSPTRMIGA